MAITLKAARVNKGLSQSEVAEILNCNRTTFSRYENDPNKMPASLFIECCKLYGVSAADIFMPNVFTKREQE